MIRSLPARLALLLCLMLPISPAFGDMPQAASLSGEGITAGTLTPSMLESLGTVEMDVRYQTSKGARAERYRGVPLWTVLSRDGALAEPKAALARVVTITGRDGYRVAFSLGEIMPDFGNNPVLIAWMLDGHPTPDGLRIVVPGDARGGRYVKDVTAIKLR